MEGRIIELGAICPYNLIPKNTVSEIECLGIFFELEWA